MKILVDIFTILFIFYFSRFQ